MFIHCLWINGKKHQHRGLGTLLIEEVEKNAKDMMGHSCPKTVLEKGD
jgi:histone acetyltransferase (RNA polymerase elongator complex component)